MGYVSRFAYPDNFFFQPWLPFPVVAGLEMEFFNLSPSLHSTYTSACEMVTMTNPRKESFDDQYCNMTDVSRILFTISCNPREREEEKVPTEPLWLSWKTKEGKLHGDVAIVDRTGPSPVDLEGFHYTNSKHWKAITCATR